MEVLKGLSPERIRFLEILRCIELGFHKALGLTEKEFYNEDFFPLPEDRPNPLAIIPEIITLEDKRLLLDIPTQMSLIEVDGKKGKSYLYLKEHKDLIEIPNRIHWVYEVEDGSRFAVENPLTSSEQETEILKKEKRTPFATIHGIALVRKSPETLKHHHFDLASSCVESGEFPNMYLCGREIQLSVGGIISASSSCAVPSFSSEI